MTDQPGWQPQPQQPPTYPGYPAYQPPPPPRRNRTVLFVVLGLVALLVAAGVVAVVLATGSEDGTPKAVPATSGASAADVELAAERDAVLDAGTEAAEVLSTLDFENVEEGLDRWESVATGDLLDQITSSRAQAVQQVQEARTKSVGTVRSAAVAELDADRGTARLLLAVTAEVTVAGGEPTYRQTRVSMTMTRTEDGWKADWMKGA